MEKQNRIVSLFGKVNVICQTYKEQETILTNLMPALLDKAFNGVLFSNITIN
jgi:hypothetical protein